jgi:hypothetical protein
MLGELHKNLSTIRVEVSLFLWVFTALELLSHLLKVTFVKVLSSS